MDKTVSDFLTKNRVSVLTILLKDGTPHAAAMHYSHKEDPLTLYFSTENTSLKCEALLGGGTTKGAVVIGFDEKEWLTLQMRGVFRIVLKEELEASQRIHYKKLPSSEKWKDDPATVLLGFTPTWWRYTDLNTEPYKIISSED